MGLERAAVLYPLNSTTVDSGTGIDIRALASTQPGATDTTQTCTCVHTDDNAFRTFDPATASGATVLNPGTLQKLGYALRLSQDMTPSDDTNCNAYLKAGTFTVNISVTINQAGGTYTGGTYTPNWRANIFSYDPAANTGTFITGGQSSAITWNYTPVTGDLGTFKTVAISCALAAGAEFPAGTILLLQIGHRSDTIPNPTVGTATWTYTLAVDDPNTNITWAAGQAIGQACAFSSSLVGKGAVSRDAMALTLARDCTGKGTVTGSKVTVAAKSSSLVGVGTITGTKTTQAIRSFDLVGKGVVTDSRTVVAAKSFTLTGSGLVSESPKVITLSRSATGKGEVTGSKAVVVSKSFDLVGKGTITGINPVQAFRTFDLVGVGTVTGRIEIPIDEVPTGGGGGTNVYPVFVTGD